MILHIDKIIIIINLAPVEPSSNTIPPPPPPPLPSSFGGQTNQVSKPFGSQKPIQKSLSVQHGTQNGMDESSEDGRADVDTNSLEYQIRQFKQQNQQRSRTVSMAGVGSENQNNTNGANNNQSNSSRQPGLDMMSDLQRVLAARRRAKEAEV